MQLSLQVYESPLMLTSMTVGTSLEVAVGSQLPVVSYSNFTSQWIHEYQSIMYHFILIVTIIYFNTFNYGCQVLSGTESCSKFLGVSTKQGLMQKLTLASHLLGQNYKLQVGNTPLLTSTGTKTLKKMLQFSIQKPYNIANNDVTLNFWLA